MAALQSMDPIEGLDFDSVSAGDDAYAVQATSPLCLLLVSKIEHAASSGNLVAAKEAFTTLSRTDVGSGWLRRPGSALILALHGNHAKVIEYLLSEGVQIGPSHVRLATVKRARAILELFVRYGWDLNTQTEWSVPPALAFAAEDFDLCSWFLDHGADPNAGCVLDITPLSAAVQYGLLEVIQLFFEHGGKVTQGQLLHYAIWRERDDRAEVVAYLLHKGAPVNLLMYETQPKSFALQKAFGLGTPLHDAAAQGDGVVMKLLLDHGADATVHDSLGFLPYQRAEANGHQAVARHLHRLVP